MFSFTFIPSSILACGLLLLSACASTPTVFSDFDARHDFSKDKTISWIHTPPVLISSDYPISDLGQSRMTGAIKSELESKGYSFVDDIKDADLGLIYTMGAREKIELVEYESSYYRYYADWGWGMYYFPYFAHFPMKNARPRYSERLPRSYTKGTIAVDIFDTKTKKPIWHTKASKRLSPQDLDSNIENATDIAQKLLADFPLIGCNPVISKQCKPF